MTVAELSPMAQDYLKLIWKCQEWSDDPVSTNALAGRLGVSPSTVSGNIKKLASLGLIDHTPYGAIQLSVEGRTAAVQMVRRHRLLETYLVVRLGYGWDEVHDEAENLEHSVSQLFIDRIDADLGHPGRDPHGDPIPDAEGRIERPEAQQLSEVEPGHCGYIARILDDDAELLRYLDTRRLVLDTHVTVDERRRFAGSLSITRESGADGPEQLDLGLAAAESIWLTTTPHRHRRAVPAGS
ncbi:metal-dependent transcriptional regulator [Microlunatus sp. GCM10028923]|uniref:metal-dependent transcriptional regulator n=1 Tax=Microlunatus sp. GCM10028923 TaxID=3273400 RepID=UPI003612D33B